MALIVGGTTVTGTQVLDATKLSGTLPAISAENLTNVPSASSIPLVSAGTVGSLAFCRRIVGSTSGSSTTSNFLRYAGVSGSGVTDLATAYTGGTWRNMQNQSIGENIGGVWQRQS